MQVRRNMSETRHTFGADFSLLKTSKVAPAVPNTELMKECMIRARIFSVLGA